ncbi:MAG: alpha/beta hydrolase [Planctomycetota bacterium]
MRLAVVFLLLVAGTASAGDAVPGRFRVYARGRDVGHELVTVRAANGHTVIEARALHSGEDGEREFHLVLVRSADTGELVRFEAHVRAGEAKKTGMFAVTGGEIVGEVRSRNGKEEEAKPFRLPWKPGTLVLAEPFAAPWLLIAARYDRDRGQPQSFPVVFPFEGRAGSVTIARREDQAIEVDRRVHLATRLLAVPDRGDAANLWLAEDGRVLVCARSVAGISAIRGVTAVLGLKPGSDPPDPPGVRSIRIRFAGAASTLAGTFSRPAKGEGPFPAVLLLSGSGPQDRNGNAPGTELQWNCLHSFAMALARAGIASLRYDERGVAKSGGVFSEAGLSDLVADAGRALAYLSTREDVDEGRVGLLGHSEGALHAAMLSSGNAGGEGTPAVRAVVLVGAPAEPLDRLLLSQVAARMARQERSRDERLRILGELRAWHEHVRLSASDVVTRSGRPRNVKWLREHMDLVPSRVYRRLALPVLLMHGKRDLQVPARHSERIAAWIDRPDTKVVLLPNVDHFLIPGVGTMRDYADAKRRVSEAALTRLIEWMGPVLR